MEGFGIIIIDDTKLSDYAQYRNGKIAKADDFCYNIAKIVTISLQIVCLTLVGINIWNKFI